ncbi:hypothetical protein QJS66_12280 [Kocuria rhizophila]|nr:hypothetical protein QJS66_12280 [Kocuria rhizophila]
MSEPRRWRVRRPGAHPPVNPAVEASQELRDHARAVPCCPPAPRSVCSTRRTAVPECRAGPGARPRVPHAGAAAQRLRRSSRWAVASTTRTWRWCARAAWPVYPVLSHGQEACQVAAALCLEDDDWLFPPIATPWPAMSRGVDPLEVMSTYRGDGTAATTPRSPSRPRPAPPRLACAAVGMAPAPPELRGRDGDAGHVR